MSDQPTSTQPVHEDAASFTQWALLTLRCELVPQSGDVWQANLPEALRGDWQGEEALRFRAVSNGQPAEDALLPTDASSKLFRWSVQRLQAQGPVAHTVPRQQPTSVHEISPKLFANYDFADGHIHLAGCTLEERPILRMTMLHQGNGDKSQLTHHFFWLDGRRVEDELVANLHLADLAPRDDRPPASTIGDLEAVIRTVRDELDQGEDEVITATLIGCKYARGKLAFDAGDESVNLPFEGWATLLADGIEKPPPYQCPLTKQESYELGVTDDGRIAAAEGIVACEESGRRVLITEVETCAATGEWVVPELLATCRVSGQRVLASALVTCSQCEQAVSPDIVKGGRCSACRALASVRKDDPRMARLLDEYPKLDRWSRWRISETDYVYLLLATSWLRQLMMVVDKHSLEVLHIATSGRLLTSWSELPSGQREELLGA